MKGIFSYIKKLARPLITFGVVIILSIMASATVCITVGLNDIDTWTSFGVGFLLQVMMIALWLPEGKHNGRLDDTYTTNKKCANEKIKKVSTPQYFSTLDKFCDYAYERNLDNYVAVRLDSKIVDYKRFLIDKEYAASLDEKVIAQIAKLKEKAKKRVKPIKSTEITSNSSIDLVYDVSDHSKSRERTLIAFKLVPALITSIVGASITFLMEPITWNTVAVLVYWIVTMCLTIVFSIKTGYDIVTVSGNDHFLRIIDFLDRFDGWMVENGLTPTTTKDSNQQKEKAPE